MDEITEKDLQEAPLEDEYAAIWCLEKYLEIDGNKGDGREEIDGEEVARAVFGRVRAHKGNRGKNSRVKRGADNPYRQNGRIQPRVSLDKTEL